MHEHAFRAGRLTLAAGLALALLLDASAAQGLQRWTGGAAGALELPDAGGQVRKLSDWRGKTVVVNFWATWCEPCREEMPSLELLRARMRDKPFEVVAVNVGESPERVARFTSEVPISFPMLYDRAAEVARVWKVRGYPTSFVVGPDGRIRYYYVGDLDWTNAEVVRIIEGVR